MVLKVAFQAMNYLQIYVQSVKKLNFFENNTQILI